MSARQRPTKRPSPADRDGGGGADDHDIAQLLATLGYGGAALEPARAALVDEGVITNPRRARISDAKRPRIVEALGRRLARHCGDEFCRREAALRKPGADPALAPSACEVCGGSANERAAQRLFRAIGARRPRIVVVGGAPDSRQELQRLVGHRVDLRLVDGTGTMTMDRARIDLRWADLVLIWGSTELAHKVSKPYATAQSRPGQVVTVARRGAAALLEVAADRLDRPDRQG